MRTVLVPDGADLRDRPASTFVPRAAIVVEIASSRDETWEETAVHFAHGVEELLIADVA